MASILERGERSPPERDLEEIFSATSRLWEKLGSRDILVTGASGFFGHWLLHSFLHARRKLGFPGKIFALTRNLANVSKAPGIQWIEGDVRSFTIEQEFSHVIHGATAAGPDEFEILSEGTRRVLSEASRSGAERVLLLSSGAVYGGGPRQTPIREDEFQAQPGLPREGSSYMDGKRASEALARSWPSRDDKLDITVARCFAFTGPYLPLDAPYAVSSFMRDIFRGKPISIRGDGSPVRSYMYASDLAVWLWHLLAQGNPGEAYNVGSEEAVSIADLARILSEVAQSMGLPKPDVVIEGKREAGRGGAWYVPDTSKARRLGLGLTRDLRTALEDSLQWHRRNPNPAKS